MLTDDQFAERLGAQLHEETADLHPAPGLTATLRRRQAKRTLGVRLAVIVPLVAATATSALVATSGPGGRAAPHASDLDDVAYVSAQIQDALGNVSDYVCRATAVGDGRALHDVDGGTETHQIDMKTAAYRFDAYGPGGRRLSSSSSTAGPTRDGLVTTLVVNYPQRTWRTVQSPIRQPPELPGGVAPIPFEDPVKIRDDIASGRVTLLGEERVNGRDTLQLRVLYSGDGYRIQMDLWVDSRTYLPIRYFAEAEVAGDRITSTVDYSWLPRTPENLAALELRPPAGFRQTQ
jgi:hypothetical protein